MRYCEQALSISREIGSKRDEGDTLVQLGKAYANLDDISKAIELYEQALAISRKIEYLQMQGKAQFNMSLALHKLGQYTEAIDQANGAHRIFEQIESPLVEKARSKLAERKETPG